MSQKAERLATMTGCTARVAKRHLDAVRLFTHVSCYCKIQPWFSVWCCNLCSNFTFQNNNKIIIIIINRTIQCGGDEGDAIIAIQRELAEAEVDELMASSAMDIDAGLGSIGAAATADQGRDPPEPRGEPKGEQRDADDENLNDLGDSGGGGESDSESSGDDQDDTQVAEFLSGFGRETEGLVEKDMTEEEELIAEYMARLMSL
jgi:hypothetical protein